MAYINGKQVCFSAQVHMNYTEEELETMRVNAWNSGVNTGYEIGKADAVKEGTITILETTKELKIEGFPKAPKTFNLVAQVAPQPTTDDVRLVRGLDYMANGINNNGTAKVLANVWLLVSTNVYNSGFVMGSIISTHNDKENLITFENGIFTLKMRDANENYYGANFTYNWVATF